MLLVLPLLAALVATPAHAEGPNELGIALGEGAGFGLVYQRAVADRWRLRANVGRDVWTSGFTDSFTYGGGVLFDLGSWGPRWYLAGTGIHKLLRYEYHVSGTLGLGLQGGPFFLEFGRTLFLTAKSGPTGSGTDSWGSVGTISWGLLFAF